MTDKPAKKEKKKKATKLQLLKAIEFIKVAHIKDGDATQTHTRLHGGYATAFNNTIAAAYPIVEKDLDVCAHTETLLGALKDFKHGDSITQRDQFSLAVKIGPLSADIPCTNPATVEFAQANPPEFKCDNSIKDHFKLVDKLTKTSGESVVQSSILLHGQSLYACDLEMIIEVWHGLNLKNELMVLPKKFVQAVMRSKENIVNAGYGENQFTIFFENGAWIRTQCYTETWPAVWEQLRLPETLMPIPDNFFDGVRQVLNYSNNDFVHFSGSTICARGVESSTSYDLGADGYWPNISVNAKKIALLKGVVNQIEFSGSQVNFYGDKVRAAITYPDGQVAL